jgi:pSer/pThr/pTyr-binding forkhead associated (FHA) protein
VEVGPDGLRVGRSADSGPLAARITETDHSNVSRLHAVLWRDGQRLYLRDVGSTNGTFVNGRRLPDRTPHELQVGDVVRFAASLSAIVVAATADQPAAAP